MTVIFPDDIKPVSSTYTRKVDFVSYARHDDAPKTTGSIQVPDERVPELLRALVAYIRLNASDAALEHQFSNTAYRTGNNLDLHINVTAGPYILGRIAIRPWAEGTSIRPGR